MLFKFEEGGYLKWVVMISIMRSIGKSDIEVDLICYQVVYIHVETVVLMSRVNP